MIHSTFPLHSEPVPELSLKQMKEVDRLMIEDFGISLLQMMENAGLGLAELIRSELLAGKISGTKITVFAGSGGNGGGALVAARRLAAWGAEVSVFLLTEEKRMIAVTAAQFRTLQKMEIPIIDSLPENPGICIDGMIGYSLNGPLSDGAAEIIHYLNGFNGLTVSLDMPSGFDIRIGKPLIPTVVADYTFMLAMPKFGLMSKENRKFTGELFLGDISVPPLLFDNLGLDFINWGELFENSRIIKLKHI